MQTSAPQVPHSTLRDEGRMAEAVRNTRKDNDSLKHENNTDVNGGAGNVLTGCSLPPSGPLYFSPKCRKHVYRLYHHTRDCTIPACKLHSHWPSDALSTPCARGTHSYLNLSSSPQSSKDARGFSRDQLAARTAQRGSAHTRAHTQGTVLYSPFISVCWCWKGTHANRPCGLSAAVF